MVGPGKKLKKGGGEKKKKDLGYRVRLGKEKKTKAAKPRSQAIIWYRTRKGDNVAPGT